MRVTLPDVLFIMTDRQRFDTIAALVSGLRRCSLYDPDRV
jgi:hypothetical protein